ncbi:hypothetical protein D1871_04565 [Nakamurella silvestris]|nr:hypothetical protein D1871_04565 [Nakamurella silvestris]
MTEPGSDDIQTQLNGIRATLETHESLIQDIAEDLITEDEEIGGDTLGGPAGLTERAPVPGRKPSRRWRHRRPRLAGSGQRSRQHPPWWNLDTLSPTENIDVTGEVVTFGNLIRARYGLQHLPPNWYNDRAVFEEVLALYASWRGAYTQPAAHHNAPNDWHEALARFIPRTQDLIRRREAWQRSHNQ